VRGAPGRADVHRRDESRRRRVRRDARDVARVGRTGAGSTRRLRGLLTGQPVAGRIAVVQLVDAVLRVRRHPGRGARGEPDVADAREEFLTRASRCRVGVIEAVELAIQRGGGKNRPPRVRRWLVRARCRAQRDLMQIPTSRVAVAVDAVGPTGAGGARRRAGRKARRRARRRTRGRAGIARGLASSAGIAARAPRDRERDDDEHQPRHEPAHRTPSTRTPRTIGDPTSDAIVGDGGASTQGVVPDDPRAPHPRPRRCGPDRPSARVRRRAATPRARLGMGEGCARCYVRRPFRGAPHVTPVLSRRPPPR